MKEVLRIVLNAAVCLLMTLNVAGKATAPMLAVASTVGFILAISYASDDQKIPAASSTTIGLICLAQLFLAK